jgi:hypothetical protein
MPALRAALVLLVLATACGGPASQPAYQLRTLRSGRTVKVLGVGRTQLPEESGPTLILRYQTDIAMSDTAELLREAEDIWHDLQAEADSAKVGGVVLSATAAPTGGVVSMSHRYNFVYEKAGDGTWHRLEHR